MRSVLELNLTTILDRCQHVTVSMNSGSVLVVINCTQEKKSGAPSYPQEKGTGALLISGERNWCSAVFRSRELVHYCSKEKETCAVIDRDMILGLTGTGTKNPELTGTGIINKHLTGTGTGMKNVT